MNLALLRKGVAAVHASAFSYNGRGAIVAGWAHGAKTTTLLAFMNNGAQFIADDQAYIDRDGGRFFGLPEPISIRARHLAELPRYRGRVKLRARARLRALSILGSCMSSVASGDRARGSRSLALRVASLGNDASTTVRPELLFERCSFAGTLERIFLSIPHECRDVVAERVDPDWLANRLVFTQRAERRRLVDAYLAFRFAFPERKSEVIEHADEIEQEILRSAVREVETYALYHPSPAPAEALFETLAPNFA